MRLALAVFAASFLASSAAGAAGSPAPPHLPPPPPQTASPSASPQAEPSGEPAGALDTRWAIGAMLGLSTDYLDFGFGARGGKTFANHIYIGGSALFHFAGDTFSGYAGPQGNYTSSASVFYLGPEGGYDFDLGILVLRAYVGVGPAFFHWTVNLPGTTASGSDTRIVFWPGATVLYDFPGSPFFIAGDVRFVSVPGGPAVGFYAFGGIHFGS